MTNRIQITKEFYRAFVAGDRRFVEQHLADDFMFSAPPENILFYRDNLIILREYILDENVDRSPIQCRGSKPHGHISGVN